MRNLIGESELLNSYLRVISRGFSGIKEGQNKLMHGSGTVPTFSKLSEQMLALKNMRKTIYYPLLSQVMQYSLSTDMVIPFDFDDGTIPSILPFIPFKTNGYTVSTNSLSDITGNASEKISTMGKLAPRIYVNLNKLGHLTSDEEKHTISNLDLYCMLESGVMAYNMIILGKASKILEDSTVLETSSRLYSNLMLKAIERSTRSINSNFETDFALFLISKFFLIYVLGKNDTEYVDDIAHKSVKYKTSLNSLKQMEEATAERDYDSLSGFLYFFYSSMKLTDSTSSGMILKDLITNWYKMYGQQTLLMIEYFPYFLHFIFSAIKGSQSISGLYRRRNDLERDGSKLYQGIIKYM